VTEDINGAPSPIRSNYAIRGSARNSSRPSTDSAIQLDGATKQTSRRRRAHGEGQQCPVPSNLFRQRIHGRHGGLGSKKCPANSERCSDVARHSVDIAHKGGDAVRRTIDGMNTIRETIQETSKRIKRLGEKLPGNRQYRRADQRYRRARHILALNASIQASMGGRSGRGFAVGGGRGAKTGGNAPPMPPSKSEVLVRTIQTDTNEAVVSMERSTTDVVGRRVAGRKCRRRTRGDRAGIQSNREPGAETSQPVRGSKRSLPEHLENMQVVREISSQTAKARRQLLRRLQNWRPCRRNCASPSRGSVFRTTAAERPRRWVPPRPRAWPR